MSFAIAAAATLQAAAFVNAGELPSGLAAAAVPADGIVVCQADAGGVLTGCRSAREPPERADEVAAGVLEGRKTPAPAGPLTLQIHLDGARWMRVVTNPPFDRPAGLAMLEAQRRAGVKIRADGAATLHCIITDKGRLSDCQVAREAPEGGGSAALALKIAKEIRLLPVGPDGLPTAGALVRMPFQFRMPFEIRPAK